MLLALGRSFKVFYFVGFPLKTFTSLNALSCFVEINLLLLFFIFVHSRFMLGHFNNEWVLWWCHANLNWISLYPLFPREIVKNGFRAFLLSPEKKSSACSCVQKPFISNIKHQKFKTVHFVCEPFLIPVFIDYMSSESVAPEKRFNY